MYRMDPRRVFAIAVLCVLISACVFPIRQGPDESLDQQAVRQNFNAYKYALLNELGSEAAELVSEKTLKYYEQLRQLALTADANELKDQPSFTRLVVLAIRLNIPSAQLRKMQSKDIFAYGVKNQWVAKETVAPYELGSINVYGNYASAEVVASTGATTNAHLEFRKDGEIWRINLTPLLERVSRERSAQISSTADENRAILSLLESMSGKKVDNSIWTPPGKE